MTTALIVCVLIAFAVAMKRLSVQADGAGDGGDDGGDCGDGGGD